MGSKHFKITISSNSIPTAHPLKKEEHGGGGGGGGVAVNVGVKKLQHIHI
jgi:hypothetical protein